jgi:hypothetical protein
VSVMLPGPTLRATSNVFPLMRRTLRGLSESVCASNVTLQSAVVI